MVIDTSALVAMLNDEPEAQRFEIAVAADHVWLMSTASYPEMATLIETRFGEPGGREPKVSGQPLLYKGDDFACIDIRAVLAG